MYIVYGEGANKPVVGLFAFPLVALCLANGVGRGPNVMDIRGPVVIMRGDDVFTEFTVISRRVAKFRK